MVAEYNDINTKLKTGMYDDPNTVQNRTIYQNLGIQDPNQQTSFGSAYNNVSPSLTSQYNKMTPSLGVGGDTTHMINSFRGGPEKITGQSLLDQAGGDASFNTRKMHKYMALADRMNNTNINEQQGYMANNIAQGRNDIAAQDNALGFNRYRDNNNNNNSSNRWINSGLGLSSGSNLNYNNQINSPKPDDTTTV